MTHGIDLTIPYTFYPLALPHWIAWALFSAAMLVSAVVGIVAGYRRGWTSGLRFGLLAVVVLAVVTMIASVVITFFVHDL